MIIKIFGTAYTVVGDIKEESLTPMLNTIGIINHNHDLFDGWDDYAKRDELVNIINNVLEGEDCKIEELELDNVIYEFEE